ncbi:MAG: MFS transporter [Tannerella sp.]|jgi:MFS family permease|nr:MFS transporter [Tannerella sp.]
MKRNLIALYLIKLSKWFSLVMPIIVLFYQDHGLDLQDIFILKSIFSVVAVTLEIPSGYMADTWGRKKCLVLGSILFFAGYLCYAFTDTFAAFIFAEILLGIGLTLVNGTDSALLYDTAEYYKQEDKYLLYEGRVTMIGNFAEAAAGIIGGFLAVYSLRYPFYGQVFVAFIGIPAAFALKEISLSKKHKNRFAEIVKIIRYSLFENKQLCYNIMFSGIIGSATLTMAWLIQPVLIQINMPTEYFGIIWTVLNLTVGFSALFSDRLDRRLGMKKTYALILVFIVGGYVTLAYSLNYTGLVILLVFYIIRGFATPILKGYINQNSFSNMRATVLSIRNFVIRLVFAAMAPFVGWLSDTYSLQTALLISAVIIFIPGAFFLVLQLRK